MGKAPVPYKPTAYPSLQDPSPPFFTNEFRKIALALQTTQNALNALPAAAGSGVGSSVGKSTVQGQSLVPAPPGVFKASGSGHSTGLVPDPGSTAGTTRFLREDATWYAPASTQINVDNYGAVGNGTTDDSTAFTNAAAVSVLSGGGTVYISPGKVYYLGSNFTLPEGITLKGPFSAIGIEAGIWTSGFSCIRLSTSKTITMGNSSTIDGCVILPYGMTFPQTSSSAWTGTAVTVSGDRCNVINSMIAGFNQAIIGTGNSSTGAGVNGLSCRFLALDNVNGINITYPYDICRITEVHCWPFLCWTGSNTLASIYRAGSAFYIANGDGAVIYSRCGQAAYENGFYNDGSSGVTYDHCYSDGQNITTSTGTMSGAFTAIGAVNNLIYTGCQAVGYDQTGASGFGINASAGNATLNGCYEWSNYNGVGIGSSNAALVSIMGGASTGNSNYGVDNLSSAACGITGTIMTGNTAGNYAGTVTATAIVT